MITRIGEGRLMTGMPGRGWGYICRFEMHPCCQLLLGQPVPARRVRRTHHGKSDDFPRWVLQKLDLVIKFFPARPAPVVQEAVGALQHSRTGIYSPIPFPASLSLSWRIRTVVKRLLSGGTSTGAADVV